MKKILLFMLGVLVALPGIARDFTYEYEGQTLTYTVLDEEAKTCKTADGFVYLTTPFAGNSISGNLIIPNVAKDGDTEYSVTSLGKYAFYKCTNLTSVIIGSSVTSIGDSAFSNCTNLKKSAYPSGLNKPFSNGVALEYPRKGAIIEDGFIYGPEKKAIYFAPLSLEGEYVIPEYVTSISSNAFCLCTNLTSVIIGSSVTSIGISPFSSCTNLKKSAYPSGLYNPFSYGLAIEYPREGAIIEDGSIYGPEKKAIYFAPFSLEGEYVIPESVTSIDSKAFNLCSGITSVKATNMTPPVMPEDAFDGLYDTALLSVPEGASRNYLATTWFMFKNIRIGDSGEAPDTYETGNLKYVLIPGKTDGENNLAVVIPGNYSSLTEITIPERFTVNENGETTRYFVDAIGYKAFNGCSNLATVTFNSRNTAKTIGEYAFAETKISTITLPETVESIGNYAFSNCASLSSIEIPGSVRTIGDHAFYETSALKEITFNEGLESIGKYAFALSTDKFYGPIYIPSTLKKVGESAFAIRRCLGVDISDLAAWCDIDFENSYSNPATNELMCYYLHLNGKTITDLVIPESVVSIKDYAFRDSKIETVKFHDALRSIGASAFNNCKNLTAVVIPGNVTSIGEDAFYNSNVSDLTFEYSSAAIELASRAFPNPRILSWDRPIDNMNLFNDRLTSLTLGNSVTEIPAGKFKDATRLSTLTLGNSVSAIGDEAFNCSNNLTEVIVPPSVESIGASAFAGNTRLKSIIMGHKVKSIGEKAFDLCPAQTVSITAQTPPTAADNTFSNYTGNLYVQGAEAAKAYYDADYCWFQFEGHVMIEPTGLDVEGGKTLTGKAGDTFQLTATLYPEDVTLPHIFWRSTNPDIATVDANGLVTLHADMSDIMAMAADESSSAHSCKIIAESLYADGPVAEVTVNNTSSGIDEIVTDEEVSGEIDFTAPVEVYNLQGVMVGRTTDNLATGFYIVRQGKNVKKIAVK